MPNALTILLALAASGPLDVEGRWVIPAEEEGGPNRGTIEIVMEDGAPVGRIASVGEAFAGTPAAEDAIGTIILWDFDRDDEAWGDGKILDPQADRTYRASIRRENGNLAVEGCLAIFCRTQTWHRAD